VCLNDGKKFLRYQKNQRENDIPVVPAVAMTTRFRGAISRDISVCDKAEAAIDTILADSWYFIVPFLNRKLFTSRNWSGSTLQKGQYLRHSIVMMKTCVWSLGFIPSRR
jgi:hypothetical protein